MKDLLNYIEFWWQMVQKTLFRCCEIDGNIFKLFMLFSVCMATGKVSLLQGIRLRLKVIHRKGPGYVHLLKWYCLSMVGRSVDLEFQCIRHLRMHFRTDKSLDIAFIPSTLERVKEVVFVNKVYTFNRKYPYLLTKQWHPSLLVLRMNLGFYG